MIRIEDLKPPKGAIKQRKRVGRGESSGHGRTSGRGNKGALSRSGSKKYPWFEGGQMPLSRRLPKKGFSNFPFRRRSKIINLRDLSIFEPSDVVTIEKLVEKGIIKKIAPVKLLGDGEIRIPLTIRLPKASEGAIEKIKNAGGTFEETL